MLKVGRAPEILYFEHMDDLNKQLLCFMVPYSQLLYTAMWAEILFADMCTSLMSLKLPLSDNTWKYDEFLFPLPNC